MFLHSTSLLYSITLFLLVQRVKSDICVAVTGFFSPPSSQLREYCLKLRNMIASEATKSEISDAIDTMMEEVSQRRDQEIVLASLSLINTII